MDVSYNGRTEKAAAGRPNSTIKDVAREAGVSVATVSRILNNLPGYSVETKRRVTAAIKQIGYQPNAVARGLVRKKTHTIGVLLPTVTSMFASELLGGIEAAAHGRGYSAIICNTDRNGSRTAEYLRVLSEKQVDGIVFTSEELTDEYERLIEDMRVPVVLVSTMSSRYQIPYVRVDDRQAAYTATKYLIDRNHVNIGMVSGTASDQIAGEPRVYGYRQALIDSGVVPDDSWVVYGDFHFDSGRRAALKLLQDHRELTAVFAASDEMAVGVLSAAWELEILVPQELSVIGYDDTKDAQMAIPPLTTVHQPIAEMGSRAVEMLVTGNTESQVLPFFVKERNSVQDAT